MKKLLNDSILQTYSLFKPPHANLFKIFYLYLETFKVDFC